nr:hypothetical protein [Tanacetum cinerariifolium]
MSFSMYRNPLRLMKSRIYTFPVEQVPSRISEVKHNKIMKHAGAKQTIMTRLTIEKNTAIDAVASSGYAG